MSPREGDVSPADAISAAFRLAVVSHRSYWLESSAHSRRVLRVAADAQSPLAVHQFANRPAAVAPRWTGRWLTARF